MDRFTKTSISRNFYSSDPMTPNVQPHSRHSLSTLCRVCGVRVFGSLKHYDIVACECGARYWALQPRRGGELKLVRHPGSVNQPTTQEAQ